MRTIVSICMLLLGIIAFPTQPAVATHGSDHGPETMNLKERFKVQGNKSAVIFPHWLHQQKVDQQCSKCHDDAKGGSKLRFELKNFAGISNDFHKQFCWPCHDAMQVPKGKQCTACHK